jgi:hypothetical protein
MKTNDLRFTDNRVGKNGEQWAIKIRLNDECKNGHQDFSITGTCWEAGKAKIDRYMIHGGACGDEISVLFPEYEIFNRLHLCDYMGIPMHCSANGFYHLRAGFQNYAEGETLKSRWCKYYRVSPDQFDVLFTAESEMHFAILLERLGIFEQWKAEADLAIKKLEELTGDEFVVDSVRTQYHRPSDEKMKEESERISNGYYSAEEKQKRVLEAEKKKLQAIDEKEETEIQKIRLEYKIKRILFSAGEKAYANYIFYSHTNTIKFNWRGFGDEMSAEEILEAKNKIENLLPEGVTFA